VLISVTKAIPFFCFENGKNNECIPIVMILSRPNQMFFDSDTEEEDNPRQRNEIVNIIRGMLKK